MDLHPQEYYEGLIETLKKIKKGRSRQDRERWDDLIGPMKALLEVSKWDPSELRSRFSMSARMRDDEDAEGNALLDEVQAALDKLQGLRSAV